MKKLKMLMPILGLTTLTGMVVPITSCSTYDRTVTLYTEYGTFSNGEKFINIRAYGAKLLKDIDGYEEPALPTYQFDGWTDEKGKPFTDDKYVNGDMVLVANFKEEEEASDPENFTTDGWWTLSNVCYKPGFVPFAKAYCNFKGDSEDEAKAKIESWILTDANIRYVGLAYEDYPVLAKVRLIGIDHDEMANGSGNNAKFTFEFADVIDTLSFNSYSAEFLGIPFNRWFHPIDPTNDVPSLLGLYLNSEFSLYLPEGLVNNVVPVLKPTILTNGYGTISSEEGDEGWYSTSNYMFPLSRAELNDTNNKADLEEQGQEFKNDKNTPYTFYDRDQEPTKDFNQMQCRIKNYAGTNTPANYWTRSPYLGDYDETHGIMSKLQWEREDNGLFANAAVIKDGGIFSTYSSFLGVGIAPAFCIGVDGE